MTNWCLKQRFFCKQAYEKFFQYNKQNPIFLIPKISPVNIVIAFCKRTVSTYIFFTLLQRCILKHLNLHLNHRKIKKGKYRCDHYFKYLSVCIGTVSLYYKQMKSSVFQPQTSSPRVTHKTFNNLVSLLSLNVIVTGTFHLYRTLQCPMTF